MTTHQSPIHVGRALRAAGLALWCGLLGACGGPAPEAYVRSCEVRDQPERHCRKAAVPPAGTLLPGAQVAVRVDAQCFWNRTGVLLTPGATYDITVSAKQVGKWQDSRLPADLATGWTGFASALGGLARRFARHDDAPMYALIGSEGERRESFFVVGHSVRHRASSAQELLFFANDWPGAYTNNQGCLDVAVRRVE